MQGQQAGYTDGRCVWPMRSFIGLDCLCMILVCEAFSYLIDRLFGWVVFGFRCVRLVLILLRVESPNPACIHSWGYRSDASAFKVARFSALQLRARVHFIQPLITVLFVWSLFFP